MSEILKNQLGASKVLVAIIVMIIVVVLAGVAYMLIGQEEIPNFIPLIGNKEEGAVHTTTNKKIPEKVYSYVGEVAQISDDKKQMIVSASAENNFLEADKELTVNTHYKTSIDDGLEAGDTVLVSSRANIKDLDNFFADTVVVDLDNNIDATDPQYAGKPYSPYTTMGGDVVDEYGEGGEPKNIPTEISGYIGEIVAIMASDKKIYIFAEEERNPLLEDSYFEITVKDGAAIRERNIKNDNFSVINFENLKLGDNVTALSKINVKNMSSFEADFITKIISK